MMDSNNNPTRTSEEDRTSQSWEPWIDDRDLHKGPVDFLPQVEESFWKKLINKYLEPHPPKDDPEEIERTRENVTRLRALRNSSVFAFFMLNAIFVLAIFLLQLNKDTIYINWPLDVKYNMSVNTAATEILVQKTHLQLEPIGLVFVVFFAIIIGVQFFAMLYHRMGTFTHLLAVTPLFSKSTSDEDELRQIEHLQRLNSVSPIVSSQDELGDPRTGRRRKTVHTLLTDLDRQPRVPTFSSQFVNRLQRSENINEASPSVLRRNRINPTIVNRLRRSTVLMEGQSVPANNRPYTSNLHQQGPRQNNAGTSWADTFVHQNTLTDDVFPNPGTFVRPQRVFEAGGSSSSEYGSRNPVIRGSRS
jgi:chitin synthase